MSDHQLDLDEAGRFTLILAAEAPPAGELVGSTWVPIPEDASAVLVRQYVADRSAEQLAEFRIEPSTARSARPNCRRTNVWPSS